MGRFFETQISSDPLFITYIFIFFYILGLFFIIIFIVLLKYLMLHIYHILWKYIHLKSKMYNINKTRYYYITEYVNTLKLKQDNNKKCNKYVEK